jgi:hypothetical protein
MLRGFIGAVCYLAVQELPFHSQDGSFSLLHKSKFREISRSVENLWHIFDSDENSATVI